MNPYLAVIITIIVSEYLLSQVILFLELRSLGGQLPHELNDVYDQDKYRESQRYTRKNCHFAAIQETFMVVVTLLFILLGGFNRVDLLARSYHLGPIVTGVLFSGILAFLATLINLPFSLYSTFVIEEQFGLNKTTLQVFIQDFVKAVLLSICLGGPLLAMVFWFFEATGERAWLYCWLAVTACIFILQFLAPVVIMPLFNRFIPLEEGELKKQITKYAKSQKFSMQGIYTMDGSKRSTRLNAFFTGFGRFRRIVFFDTLIEKLTASEVVAVLAHEMGHFKRKHIYKMMIASILQMGVMFLILSLFLENPQLSAAFGMEHISLYASLFFFSFLFSPVSTLLAIVFNYYSRKHEYEADAWAAETTGSPHDLIQGLKKLSSHNLANITPHPLNVAVNYSHPPLLQRIRALTCPA